MKPILFNAEMVRAIIHRRKTVTRRVVNPQPRNNDCEHEMITFNDMLPQYYSGDYSCVCRKCGYGVQAISGKSAFRPTCRPGDILYVRETWNRWPFNYDEFIYKADGCYGPDMPWHPSIHMPKEAARLFLLVTDVRVERLQDITEEQARAEGVSSMMVSVDPVDTPDNERTWHKWGPALAGFIGLWDRTIPKDKLPRYGWEANPWVWVITFERISKEEALKNA